MQKINHKQNHINEIQRIELDLTDFCNLQCPGCPTPQGKNKLNWEKTKPLLQLISTRNKIDDITICGNGGEPTLHPDITIIIEDLSIIFPGVQITLSTNGENLKYFDTERLKHLQERLTLEWSIDGHTNEIHQITRVSGKLNNVLKNLKNNLVGFNNIIYTTRHLKNENYINDIYNFILKETGIEPLFRDTTRQSGDLYNPSKISKNGNVTILNEKLKFSNFKILEKIYGIEPNFNFYFSPDGRLYPCAAYYYNDFNIPSLYYYDIDPAIAYNKFNIFAYEYCKFHRESKDTDHKRCCLECGIDKTFKFDTFEEIIN